MSLVPALGTSNGQGLAMKDLQAHLETLHAQIAETLPEGSKEPGKARPLWRLVARYKVLAAELVRAIAEDQAEKE